MAIHMCGGTWTGNKLCTAEICNSHKPCANSMETWTGCVIHTGEHNWHDDSDFYAVVWDEEAQQTRHIEYASTRGWTYHNYATVDADPATVAKAEAYLANLRAEHAAEQAVLDAKLPLVGKEVRSLTTRGKNKDVIGIIRRIGNSEYRYGAKTAAIEVAGENKYRYIDLDRVEVINPDQYLPTT
jgi:hypothetical protein